MFRPVCALLFCTLLPSLVQSGPVPLSANDLVALDQGGAIAAGITPPPPDAALPIVPPETKDPSAGLLQRLEAQGKAAGFSGLLYDNRDRKHSEIPQAFFPRLARIVYDETLVQTGRDYGLAGDILFPAITIGNSSTAVTGGDAPRSLPRLAMTTFGGPERAFRLYASNALYVYPEHRDHDARDLFPANWPYMIASQGSSGSDQPFLKALFFTLAAFQPETRARLEQEGLIAPTLQMILRRSLRPVLSRAAYLTGLAHPPVFNRDNLVPGRMMSLAAAMAPDAIPPMVELSVVTEDFDAGPRGLSERLFDTPSAVARVWRSEAYERSMTLSAAETVDPNGRSLDFTWVLLRGDPDQVEITPSGPGNVDAEITLRWKDPINPRLPGPPGSRIDIGVFASNGAHDSAPAIVSVAMPLHEGRTYALDPDGTMVLTDKTPRPGIPIDPLIFPEDPTPAPVSSEP